MDINKLPPVFLVLVALVVVFVGVGMTNIVVSLVGIAVVFIGAVWFVRTT